MPRPARLSTGDHIRPILVQIIEDRLDPLPHFDAGIADRYSVVSFVDSANFSDAALTAWGKLRSTTSNRSGSMRGAGSDATASFAACWL